MENVESRMMQRNLHLTERCILHGLDQKGIEFFPQLFKKIIFFYKIKIGNDSLHKANPWEFLINKKYQLVWCNVFKAASTSWMYNFNLLAGYSPQFLKKSQMVPLTLARKKYPRPSLKDVSTSV